MLIKAAINGGRSKAEQAAVPVTPDEQAAAVVECLQAGVDAVHLHVRFTSSDQRSHLYKESLYPEDVGRTLLAVRSAVAKANKGSQERLRKNSQGPIGVSTGAWILPDPAERLGVVAAWEVLPDFASVNFGEDGAVSLAKLLLSRGVEVEAGLCDAGAAEVFLQSGLAPSCLRVLLEPQEQDLERALETVGAIEQVLDAGLANLPRRPPFLLHGTEATAWSMMDAAIARGYDLRIGLEDTLALPDGRMARDNVELVAEAMRRRSS